MKHFILCLVLVALSGHAWTQSEGMVVIKGVLAGDLKGYNKMYLYSRTSNDSAEIKEGHYSFSFPYSEATMKMLHPEYVKETRQMYQPFGILIAGPGTYYVTSDITKGMYASSEVKGPESMVLYRRFEKDWGKTYTKINKALADLYGPDWYKMNEKDAHYKMFQSSSDSLREKYLFPVIEKLVRDHPDSYASAFVLAGSGRQIHSMAKKEQLLALLSPRMKQSGPGKKFGDYIQGLKSSSIGNVIANFTLPDPQGQDVTMGDFKGKYVLIDFWASWCAPCRKSFPHMRDVYKTYKSNQFEIYSISIDEDKSAWLKAIKEENNPWPQSLDTKNISQKSFAVTGVPTTFLIDPAGRILMKEVGFEPNGAVQRKLAAIFGH